ncbi:MAG TPA: glutamine amidotransferase [Syntrophomonadaceae bacterium]|nr:glutamine amidotransferase [Syntrophomonadaceae bacterium]
MALFTIIHMYPDLMNLYGDRGNLICLQKRLEWYGHAARIKPIGLGENLDYNEVDFLFMGGGSDREQGLVYQDLLNKSDRIMAAVKDGLPVLAICGAYQLLGAYYRSPDGQKFDGLGLFQFHTESEKGRLIGNIVIESTLGDSQTSVVGFENHGGRTYFEDKNLQPLGRVLKGFGNNGKDGGEGLKYHNLIGSYLHGPLLPKNPVLADYFIDVMCSRRGVDRGDRLDDEIENYAHQEVKKKLLGGKV